MWLVGIVAGLVVFIWLSGPLFGPLFSLFEGGPPKLKSLTLDLNGRKISLAQSQGLVLRPLDHLRVVGFETNLLFQGGLSLEGKDFVAKPLMTGAKVSDVLPVNGEPRSYGLVVKKRDRVLGEVALIPVSLPVDRVLMSNEAQGRLKITLLEEALALDPGNPILLDKLFQAARDGGDERTAAKALADRNILVTSPGDMAALAELYQLQGQAKKRARLLAVLAKLEPEKNIWADELMSLAEKSEDQGLKLDALKELAHSSHGARSTEASKKLGLAYVQSGKWAEAAAAYEEAAKLDPDDVNIHRNLATVYGHLDQPQKRLGALLNASRLEPGDVGVLKDLAVMYGKLGQEDKRRETLKRVVKLAPQEVDALKVLARAAKGQEAVDGWEDVLRLSPEDHEGIVALIKLLQPGGASEKVVGLYEKLVKIKPQDAVAHYNLGLARMEIKRYHEAEKSLARALELDSQDGDILLALWEAQKAQNKTAAALETALRLIKAKPKELELYRYVFKGYNETGELNKLEQVLVGGVKQIPDSAELWKLLSLTRLEQKDPKGAAQALATAVGLNPKDLDDRLRLIRLYEAQGRTKEIVAQLLDVVKFWPDKVEHRLKLARLLAQEGQVQGAIAQYDAILELDPDHEEAEQARLELKLKVLQKDRKQ